MPEITVKGDIWDVKSIDGNIVTLADGSTIEVRDETAKSIEDQLGGEPAPRSIFKKKTAAK